MATIVPTAPILRKPKIEVTGPGKYVRIGFVTIYEGEKAAIWSLSGGSVRFVEGPKTLFLFRSYHQNLARYTANPDEYLVVQHFDGKKEMIRGPTSVWVDPTKHKAIHVNSPMQIRSKEAVIVYQESEVERKVTRTILYGPGVYVPQPGEWIHQFEWHGHDIRAPPGVARKTPRALAFHNIRLLPDSMYYDAEQVRTSDDAQVTLKFMMFYEIKELPKLLDTSHDPIAEMINALSSDIIQLTGGMTFEQFKQNVDKYNDLSTFRELCRRSAAMGITVGKVLFRGYTSSPKLQAMHDNAIEARTALKLEQETVDSQQKLLQFKLSQDILRDRTQQQHSRETLKYTQEVEESKHQLALKLLRENNDAKLALREQESKQEIGKIQARNAEQLDYYRALQQMGVSLTDVLVAEAQKDLKILRVESTGGAGTPPVHFHTSSKL